MGGREDGISDVERKQNTTSDRKRAKPRKRKRGEEARQLSVASVARVARSDRTPQQQDRRPQGISIRRIMWWF